MNQRERMMVLALGVLLLGGLGYAAYALAAKPILDKQKSLSALKADVVDLEGEKANVELKNMRLKELNQRSLPSNVNFAKQEYDELLIRLLQDVNAPRFNVEFDSGKSASTTGIPLLNPDDRRDKTTTYQRLVYKIAMKRASLDTVMAFLKRYYQLNLLHQITLLELKREGSVDLSKDDRPVNERADLTVNITTEAIILNGTPARRTLLYVPDANGAVVGGPMLFDMRETPSVGREMVPYPFEKAYTGSRDYFLVSAKDPFHGALPTPPPPKDIVKKDDTPVVPPKPDYSRFIHYSTKFHTYDGTDQSVEILIRDQINNEDYNLTLTQSGEKVKVVMQKYGFEAYRTDPSKRKVKMDYKNDGTLEISKYTMRTKHLFKVYGLDGDALIIGEKPTGLESAAKPTDTKAAPTRGAPGSGRPPLPPPDPRAAVVGGLVVTAPQTEKIYRWEHNKKLSEIVELKGKEAEKAVQRAQSSLLDQAADAKTSLTTDGK